MALWNRALDPNATLDTLLARPPEGRDDGWRREFLATIPDTILAFEPEVSTGPDGFPYVVVRRVGSSDAGSSTLRQEAVGLTDAGVGVALEPEGDAAVWVFSLGALAGLRMFANFDEPLGWSSPDPGRGPETIERGETAQVGAPNEAYLPLFLRGALGRFLAARGVIDPHVALVLRQDGRQRLLAYDTDDETVLDYLRWFLPPGYGWIALDPATVRDVGVRLLDPIVPTGTH